MANVKFHNFLIELLITVTMLTHCINVELGSLRASKT